MKTAGLARALDAIASTHIDQTPMRYDDERWQREVEYGSAAHEIAHAVCAVAVEATVQYVELSLDTLRGLCSFWFRDRTGVGAIVAEIAVALAGAAGYERATGDIAGAVFYAGADHDDIDRILADLPKALADDLRADADRVVRAVIQHLWPAIARLAERLLVKGWIAGSEVHALVEGRYACELALARQTVGPLTADIERLRAAVAVRGGALSVMRGGPS